MKKLIAGILMMGTFWYAQAGEAGHTFDVSGSELETITAADTITLDHLVGMNKKQFKGKTLADFLKSPEAKGHQEISYRLHEDGRLQALKVKFTDKLYLNVYLKDFQFEKPIRAAQTPDLQLLKDEIIEEMRVVYILQQ